MAEEQHVGKVLADPKRQCRIELKVALWAGLIMAILVTISMVILLAFGIGIAGAPKGAGIGGGLAYGLLMSPFIFIMTLSYVLLPISAYNLIMCKERLAIDWVGLVAAIALLVGSQGGAIGVTISTKASSKAQKY